MAYLKKGDISEMKDHELLNAFELTVTNSVKSECFTKRGTTPKLSRQLDWIREELLQRMK